MVRAHDYAIGGSAGDAETAIATRKAGCVDPVVIGDQHAADCETVYGHLGLSCNAVCDRAERRRLAADGFEIFQKS